MSGISRQLLEELPHSEEAGVVLYESCLEIARSLHATGSYDRFRELTFDMFTEATLMSQFPESSPSGLAKDQIEDTVLARGVGRSLHMAETRRHYAELVRQGEIDG